MERGEFFNAAKTYRAVYNKLSPKNERELRGVVAYRLATCYRRLNQAPRASAAYQNAIRYEYPDSMAFYYLGRSLQAEGKYNPAIDAYTAFSGVETGRRSRQGRHKGLQESYTR